MGPGVFRRWIPVLFVLLAAIPLPRRRLGRQGATGRDQMAVFLTRAFRLPLP